MGRHYPKDLNIPKDEVLRRRAQRKANRQAVGTATLRSKMGHLKDKGDKYKWETRFRLGKKHQEYKNQRLCFHISRNEDYDTILVKAKEPSLQYIDWLWRQLQLQILPMDWALRILPNAKEQTESAAAFFGVKDILPLKQSTVIVVGDGSSPRCGGLFAFFAQNVVSVDPMMRKEFVKKETLPNLQCVASTIETWIEKKKEENSLIANPVVIIAVHAHVTFQVYLEALLQCIQSEVPLVILSVACCFDLFLTPAERTKFNLSSFIEYDDWAIHSPHRTVRRWARNIASPGHS